jgi:hypothetical protein
MGRHQTSMSYRSRLGTGNSENGGIKWPRHRFHSTGGSNRAVTGMERHCDRRPTCKTYWAKWKFLTVRNGVLERNWESANGQSQIAQIVIPRSRVKDMVTELHGGPSGGHLGVSKTLNKFRQRFCWLQVRADIEKWCQQCDTCAASWGPWTRNQGQMHQYNVGAPFERLAIDVAGPFPRSDQGNWYFLIAMDYFTKWPEVYSFPSQEVLTIADALVTNCFCHISTPVELHNDQGHNFKSHLL